MGVLAVAMPVYLFTYHAYGTWWPDRSQGFVQKGKGIQPTNRNLAVAYRRAAKHEPMSFTSVHQRTLIKKLLSIAETDDLAIYGVTVDQTHVHALVGWKDSRSYSKVRGRIKNLLSLQLTRLEKIEGRPWFGHKSSRKCVKDESHFEYLLHVYLPKHFGWQWYRRSGWAEPPPRGGGYSTPLNQRQ